MLTIIPIPALSDNYIWLLISPDGQSAYAVDPSDANPVLKELKARGLKLCGILITHHHWDHVGGIPKLLEHYPKIPVFGPAQETIEGVNHPVQQGSNITLNELQTSFKILDIPGHTLGHIAYYNEQALFCGDTLFACGCGRIFEGTPPMMYNSLGKLMALQDELMVYCAHEYTEANLQFALRVEPDNPKLRQRLAKVQQQRQADLPSLPVPLKEEKDTNPFLRCDDPAIVQAVSKHAGLMEPSTVEVFAALREWKNKG